MCNNRISNVNLFTPNANDYFKKHINSPSRQVLETIDRLVDWNLLIQPLEQSISHFERGGRPFSMLVIVKCFILQTIYHLSDPRLEEEIADPSGHRKGRRSFQIFQGLSSGDAIPDETTICRYRELFAREKLDRKLFQAFNDQLKKAGWILEKGTIIDASIKQSYTKPSAQNRDKDAAFLKRGNMTICGYKAHIGIDAKTKVIHSTESTLAPVHDSEMFDHLLTVKETALLADKGYANEQRTSRLRQEGIFCGVLDKSYRSRPLSGKLKKRNKKLSVVRYAIERTLAFMRHVQEYGKCRYYSLGRNRLPFHLTAVMYNLDRWSTLEICPA
jgi:IS5 family transposase